MIADGGTWTRTMSPPQDFESCAAANSATSAHNDIYYTILFLMCQHFFRKKVSKFDYVCELGEMFDDNLFGIPVIP